MMNYKTKEVSRLEAIWILKDIKRKIQSMKKNAGPDVIDECWNKICERLDRFEIPGNSEEFGSLDRLIKLFAELHGEQTSDHETQNQSSPDG